MTTMFRNESRDKFISIEPNYEDKTIEIMVEDGQSRSIFTLEKKDLFQFTGVFLKAQNDFKDDSKMNQDNHR